MRLIDADQYKKKLYEMMPEFDEEDSNACITGQTIHTCIEVLDDTPFVPQLNVALTLGELREMVGEPVYHQYNWFVIAHVEDDDFEHSTRIHMTDGTVFEFCVNKGSWPKFYRYKPEEGAK